MSSGTKSLLFYVGIIVLALGLGVISNGWRVEWLDVVGVFHNERSIFWIGQQPLKCYGNQVIHVRSRDVTTHEAGFDNDQEGTITAMGHCHVIVEDSKLTAKQPIVALEQSVVTVKNSEIDCKGFGDCIAAEGHARVDLEHATIRASIDAHPCKTCDTAKEESFGNGVSLAGYASLLMNGGLIDANGGTDIDAHDGARIELHDATLKTMNVVDKLGDPPTEAYAFELRDSPHVEIFGGVLEGAMCAIWIDTNATVALHGTKIIGNPCRFPQPKNVTGLRR